MHETEQLLDENLAFLFNYKSFEFVLPRKKSQEDPTTSILEKIQENLGKLVIKKN
jgi:hypothetical protein